METVTSADGTEIAFERTGSGPPLVLVHGASIDHRYWEYSGVRSTLAEHCTVYAMDCRGHGESEHPDEFELEAEFEDVAAVVDSIDEPVTLLGESGGAFYSLETALRTDNLNGLILHEPAFAADGDGLDIEDEVAEMTALLGDGEYERATVLFLEDIAGLTPEELELLRTDPTWSEYVDVFVETVVPKLEAEAKSGYEFDPERFAAMTTPTLLVVGTESTRWLRETTRAVDDALSNSRVVTLDGHGHEANITAPERFTDEVLSFVHETN